jgi:DNA-binding NtrC family response regulator
LIVDDEEGVVLKHKMAAKKYTDCIYTAQDGRQALDILKTHDDIAVVCTDIQMPGVDGIQLIGAASEYNPLLQFIIISQMHEKQSVSILSARSNVTALPKPVESVFFMIALMSSFSRYRDAIWLQTLTEHLQHIPISLAGMTKKEPAP